MMENTLESAYTRLTSSLHNICTELKQSTVTRLDKQTQQQHFANVYLAP